MKTILTLAFLMTLTGCSTVSTVDARSGNPHTSTSTITALENKQWIHGSQDCKSNNDPAIDIYRHDHASYILRQSKCLSYEAPFIYLLIGEDKALVVDTGATESALDFPLYKTIKNLIDEHSTYPTANKNTTQHRLPRKKILIIHSHSHGDHYAGDAQFSEKPDVTVIEPNGSAVRAYFNLKQWPSTITHFDLGGRRLTIIPTPGHQEDAISIYDSQTKWLLSGDTLYPGYIYVKNWPEYKQSIARLVSFSKNHNISAILGAHIEMTKTPGEYYPIGTTYQPDEANLTLQVENLTALHTEMQRSDKPQKLVFDKFIVTPMSSLQKIISAVATWFVKH